MARNSPVSGRWWRFTRYEMWGTYLRPAPDAELEEYDPWEGVSSENRRSQRPYQQLLSLFEDVRASEFLSSILAPGSERKVLDWCSRHGLLGILPHETVSITLHAQWDLLDTSEASPDIVQPWISTYTRLANGWVGQRRGYDVLARGSAAGSPLSPEEYRPEMPKPKAVMQELSENQLVEHDVASAWGPYFPEAVRKRQGATFQYPVPLTDDFWWAYGEPVRQFMQGAGALHEVVEGLKRYIQEGPDSPDEGGIIRRALAVLPRLLAPVGTDVVLEEDGRPALKWIPSSLLSAYTIMAVEDILTGQFPSRCPTCGRYYTSSSQKSIYCSERCRQTAQKRAQRARKKNLEI